MRHGLFLLALAGPVLFLAACVPSNPSYRYDENVYIEPEVDDVTAPSRSPSRSER